MKANVVSGGICDALLRTVRESNSLRSLSRALRLTPATLQMATVALSGGGDRGDEAALVAVAYRLFPGPYAAASVLGVPAGEVALFGESLLISMERALPAKAA